MNEANTSTHKLVVILNKKVETGVAINAASHSAIGLMAEIAKDQSLVDKVNFQNYADAEGQAHGPVSGLSLIVLRATSSEIRKARRGFEDSGIVFVDYHDRMVGGTYIDQLERSKNSSETDLTYLAIAAFGSSESINPITKRLSLWK